MDKLTVVRQVACKNFFSLPLERSTPKGLGEFLRKFTRKSMGMSLGKGGLYSCKVKWVLMQQGTLLLCVFILHILTFNDFFFCDVSSTICQKINKRSLGQKPIIEIFRHTSYVCGQYVLMCARLCLICVYTRVVFCTCFASRLAGWLFEFYPCKSTSYLPVLFELDKLLFTALFLVLLLLLLCCGQVYS